MSREIQVDLRGILLFTAKLPVLGVLQGLNKNLFDMCIIKRVIDGFSFLAAFNDPEIPQITELVRDGGLSHAKQKRQVMHAQLALKQGIDQFYAGRVAESLKPVGYLRGGLIIDQSFFDLVELLFRAHAGCIAFFNWIDGLFHGYDHLSIGSVLKLANSIIAKVNLKRNDYN